MNSIGQKWRDLRNAHILFFSYRWVMWAMAGLAITLPDLASELSFPNAALLLMLVCVLNIVATTLAQPYVRVAQRRPLVLGLDLLLGVALVWLGGGGMLPFFPYALGALVLPAMLFGWRGALISSLLFVVLDQIALIGSGAEVLPSRLLLRASLPVAAALAFALFARLSQRSANAAQSIAFNSQGSPAALDGKHVEDEAGPTVYQRFAELSATSERSFEQRSVDAPRATQLTAIRAAAEQGASEQRRAIYEITPGLDIDLAATLDQLSGQFRHRHDIDLRMNLVGDVQRLSRVQHTTLLRLAQEALLNIQQHAHAHCALLTLHYEPRAITLTIQDDGVGLLDGTHERPGVHALRAMRYRIAELDGQLDVFEGESGGVTVRGTLPLDGH